MILTAALGTKELGETVIAAMVAGLLVTLMFSLGLLGAIRAAEAAREARRVEAGLFAALAIIGGVITAAAIVFGIIVMSSK